MVLMVLMAPGAELLAQGATITGRVLSEQGNTLEVGNVYITEMNISVGLNAQGRYTITIPAERVRSQQIVLRARAIGYVGTNTPMTLTPGPHTHDFLLVRDINRLQEVVVTGMSAGTEQKKTAYTVTALTNQDMPVPGASALSALEGKVPGAQIVTPNGRPGTQASIVLRGPKSIDGNIGQGPLIMVDGIILNGTMSEINPEDIENVEIVKGAAASSLYGSRAGNGVISITTRSAKNQSPGIRLNTRSELGWQDIAKEYPYAQRTMMMLDEKNQRFCVVVTGLPDCSRTIDLATEAFRVNDQGGDYALAPYPLKRDFGIGNSATKPELRGLFQINQFPVNYDPIAQAKAPGIINTNTVDASGKFGNTGFFSSFSNLNQLGAVRYEQGYRRQSARVNVSQSGGDMFDTQIQTYYARAANFPDNENWFNISRQHPSVNLLATDSKGRLFIRSDVTNEGQQNYNPVIDNVQQYGRNDNDRFLGSVTTRFIPAAWVDFSATANMDRQRSSSTNLQDRGYRTTALDIANNTGNISDSSSALSSYNVGLDATARHDFRGDLRTRFQTRYTYEQQDGWGVFASGSTLTLAGLQSLTNATTSITNRNRVTSIRALGYSGSANFEFKEKYILDGLVRRDGSSLFGAANRWNTYGRASLAYRLSDESWWKLRSVFDDFKLRASVGSAGGRPPFADQYQTLTVGTGGSITANTLGNVNLKPEYTLETEYGIDAQAFSKYGLTLTYARDITTHQILNVPPSVSSGFSSQFKNAGMVEGKTWETSLNIPIFTNKNTVWSGRLNWDANRSYIRAMDIPTFTNSSNNLLSYFRVGERLGNMYGRKRITSCSELDPADGFDQRCGPGKEWQINSDGYVVWVGAGNSLADGVTKNLWQMTLPGCIVKGVAVTTITGAVACKAAGGIVNAPYGLPLTSWGMLTVLRDSTGTARTDNLLGNTQPLWRLTFSQNFQFKKLNVYALLDHSHGNKVYNQQNNWSLGDFLTSAEDQSGKTVETAKPIGYYWRAPSPDNGAGVGGFYDVLGSNEYNIENATYTKLREVSIGYQVGRISHLAGDWTVSAIGRNLMTISKFSGWDPEVGDGGGFLGSAALSAVQSAGGAYPQVRTFTFTLSSKF
jgi:TonB-linked SusC/RagA family outer membrane protein